MSEQDPQPHYDQLQDTLEQFERSIKDPFAERVIASAREYNQMLKEMINASVEDKNSIIHALDNEWGSIMGDEMTLTAQVSVPPIGDQIDAPKVFLDGVRVVSNGFAIINEPIMVADEEIGIISRVVHHMYARAGDIWSNEQMEGIVDPDVTVSVAAEIDDALLELDGASIERAISWLGLTCPELIEEIDARLLNTQANEEADAFLALRGLDINEYMNISDTFTRNCIDIYLNSVISFDKKLPYSVVISGYTRRADQEESKLYATETDQLLAYVPLVGTWPKFSDAPEDAGKWDICVQIVDMPKSKDAEDMHLIVPADSFSLMYSVRNSFYEA